MMFLRVVILLDEKSTDMIVLQFIKSLPIDDIFLSVMLIPDKIRSWTPLFRASLTFVSRSDMSKFVREKDDSFFRCGGFFSTNSFGTQNHLLF